MDLKRVAKNTAKTLISYLTYQALRIVLDQLGETDPPRHCGCMLFLQGTVSKMEKLTSRHYWERDKR
jgi:hypothetical protein